MSKKHRHTLERLFFKPVPSDLPWAEIEGMLGWAGVTVKGLPGSMVALVKDGEVMVVSRPRPEPLTVRATGRDIAAFLKAAGIKP